MINILLSRAEALLIVELVNKARDSLVQTLVIGVEEENDRENLARTAKDNYVANLENEISKLDREVLALREANNAAKNPVADAPYGLKKDGTPRAKPGRKTPKRKTKGTK